MNLARDIRNLWTVIQVVIGAFKRNATAWGKRLEELYIRGRIKTRYCYSKISQNILTRPGNIK